MFTKGASTTSTRRRDREADAPERARRTPTPHAVKTRGRKREARRWLEILAARCTNGAHQPHPLKVAELFQIYDREMTRLEKRDPGLFAAVNQRLSDRVAADTGITMEEWRRRALRRADRINSVRKTLPPQQRLADLRYVRPRNRRR